MLQISDFFQVVELREYSAKTEYLKEEDKRRKEAATARRKISQKRLEKLQRKPEERRKDGRKKGKRRLLPTAEEYKMSHPTRLTRRRRIFGKHIQRF